MRSCFSQPYFLVKKYFGGYICQIYFHLSNVTNNLLMKITLFYMNKVCDSPKESTDYKHTTHMQHESTGEAD